jgi:hypothetical protein
MICLTAETAPTGRPKLASYASAGSTHHDTARPLQRR